MACARCLCSHPLVDLPGYGRNGTDLRLRERLQLSGLGRCPRLQFVLAELARVSFIGGAVASARALNAVLAFGWLRM